MKFTLTDYQKDAVGDLLNRLTKAKELYLGEPARETSVALTAPTGAGKTVIAAATIEALFFGSEEFNFKADPSAVVIWFSDSPDLNEQSLFRLMQASEKLTFDRLKIIRPPFAQEALEPRRVYFVNTARFGKNSRLVRGFESKEGEFASFADIAPDDQAYTIWQTIANTIEDESRTVYFVLDEAHRGFNTKRSSDRTTIVRQLVDGVQTGIAMPIVVGISATIQRFNEAMKAASERNDRLTLEPVIVDTVRVQESGLLKDSIKLEIPGEVGNFDETLVKEAAKKLSHSTARWKAYANREKMASPVVPLMVLQIPNNQENDEVGRALDAIRSVIDNIDADSIRHVLADKKPEIFGNWEVENIDPQRVQETTNVRILIAKEAISTGWDCPRAEVLVSFRVANDQTHIAQLLGRMVRSPLARRIPGDDSLNSVDCILPKFDKTTAGKVVRYITGDSEELPPMGAKRVLINAKEMKPNPNIGEDVWAAFDAMATQTVPKRGVRPIKRLVALAHALSSDGVRADALAHIKTTMHASLDTHATDHPTELKSALDEIRRVHIETLIGRRDGSGIEYRTRTVVADERAVRTGFDEAQRVFGSDIAQSYVNHIVDLNGGDEDELRDAFIHVSAMATITVVHEKVDAQAEAMAAEWFEVYREAILALTDERQQEYENIRSMAVKPQTSVMRRPRIREEAFSLPTAVDTIVDSPTMEQHLMSDEEGLFPIGSLNQWEQEVVAIEIARKTSVGWYRNPAHNGADSLTIAYRNPTGEWRSLHPDFVFFQKRADGTVAPSIVDPHGIHLEDWHVKLIGLAAFAERYGDSFDRILSLVKIANKWRALDMKRADVRDTVRGYGGEAEALYKMDVAQDYS